MALTYDTHYFILWMPMFPFLNTVSFFIVIGIGADDVFIYVDAWKQAPRYIGADAPLADRVDYTLRRSGAAMFVTSFTTSFAFFANLAEDAGPAARALAALGAAVRRAVVAAAFVVTKQPLRIQQVLRQVYPVFPERCDDDLVASIEYPARDPNAAEVFYRIVSRNGNGPADPARSVDALLARLAAPLLLCWGERDPWVVSAIGDRYEAAATALGRDVTRVSIDGGHCPHDENPAQVNAALLDWMGRLA